jgi:hypothetical protein
VSAKASHSQCVHLAATTQQPLACIINDDGTEYFACVACSAETVGKMLQTVPGKGVRWIADRIRFDECPHDFAPAAPHCPVCYRGVHGYLSVVLSMARFEGDSVKRFTHRFRRLLAEMVARYQQPKQDTRR